ETGRSKYCFLLCEARRQDNCQTLRKRGGFAKDLRGCLLNLRLIHSQHTNSIRSIFLRIFLNASRKVRCLISRLPQCPQQPESTDYIWELDSSISERQQERATYETDSPNTHEKLAPERTSSYRSCNADFS